MSFDVYLTIGAPGASNEDVRGAFNLSSSSAPDEAESWALQDCELLLERSLDGRVTDVSVHRPTGDEALWRGLFALMTSHNAVFFFPHERPLAVVADTRALEYLPEEMREHFTESLVVRSAKELKASLDA